MIPRCLGTVGSVRASTKIQSASVANDVQIFWPSITHSSPSSTARVVRPARSEPAFGSENPWHHESSPERMRGRKCALLLLGPPLQQGVAHHLHADGVAAPDRAAPSPGRTPPPARPARAWSCPAPPYSVGHARPSRPFAWSVVRQVATNSAASSGGQRADPGPVGGEVLGEEGPDAHPERLGLGGGTQVHGRTVAAKLTDSSSVGHARGARPHDERTPVDVRRTRAVDRRGRRPDPDHHDEQPRDAQRVHRPAARSHAEHLVPDLPRPRRPCRRAHRRGLGVLRGGQRARLHPRLRRPRAPPPVAARRAATGRRDAAIPPPGGGRGQRAGGRPGRERARSAATSSSSPRAPTSPTRT